MAFTVEDGTKPEGANAYISVAYADSYFTDRGIAAWTGDNAAKEKAIVKATDYIDKRFGRRFRGYRESRDQELEWPRMNAVDNDGWLLSNKDEIPRQLKKACAEYALRALTAALVEDPTGASGEVEAVREKVGPIEEETRYRASVRSPKSATVSDYNIPEYPAADMLLEELLRSTASRTLARG